MKRRPYVLITAFLLVACIAACLCACEKADEVDGQVQQGESVILTFFVDGTMYGITVCSGNTLAMPVEPEKNGYAFVGWFYDAELTLPFVAEDFVAREDKTDINLYAAWSKTPQPPSDADEGEDGDTDEEEQPDGDDDGDGEEVPEVVMHTVTFMFDGKVIDEQQVADGKSATLPLDYFAVDGNELYSLVVEGNYTQVSADETVSLSYAVADEEDKGIFTLSYISNLNVKDGKLYIEGIKEDYPFDWIVLPDTWGGLFRLSGITSQVFSKVPHIKNVIFGGSFQETEWTAFRALSLLESVSFAADEENFAAVGLFVTDAAGETLIAYLGQDEGELNLPQGVAKIADGAFEGAGFVGVSVPESVTEIGARAFANCALLASVSLPDSVCKIGESAFENCVSLRVLEIPADVILIGNRAFAGCVSAEEVDYRAVNAQSLVADNQVFDGAGALNGLTFVADAGVGAIPARLFDAQGAGSIYLKSAEFAASGSLVSIGARAFAGTEITSLIIPASVETIASGAFADCAALVRTEYRAVSAISQGISGTAFAGAGAEGSVFVIGKETESIPDYLLFSLGEKVAFDNLVFESGALAEIGVFAFAGASFTGTVVIPASVENIADGAFSQTAFSALEAESGSAVYVSDQGVLYSADMTSLVAYPTGNERKTYAVSELTEEINAYAFAGSVYLEEIEISCARVGDFAFYNSKALTDVMFAEGVEEIETGAFSGCSALLSLSCPSTLVVIGENAFAYCGALFSAVLNEGLRKIGSRAFAYCASLGEVVLPSTIESIGQDVFVK